MRFRQKHYAFDPPLLAVLSACLLLAALKNDTSLAFDSDQLSEFISHPWVTFVKQRIFFITLPVIFAAAAYSLLHARYRFSFNAVSVLVCMLPLYAAFRSSFEDMGFALKPLQAFALFAFISAYIAFRRAGIGWRLTSETASWAFLVFAVTLVGINLFTYAAGYGYVGTSQRFFGTTVQPNFIGAQMAICGIVFLYFAVTGTELLRPVAALLLVAAVFLIVQSGSRTGLVIFGVGCGFGIWRLVGMRSRIAAIVLAGAVLVILLSSGWRPEDGVLDVYQRGGTADTRTAAWLYLIDQIARRPLLGLGLFEGSSENSLMRGWSAFGLPYLLIMVTMIGLAALTLHRANRPPSDPPPSARLLSGLFFGLVAGSIFEGYLCDNLTVTIITFVIVVSVAHAPEKEKKANRVLPRTLGQNASAEATDPGWT